MAFRRSHPRQKRTCEEYKVELEEKNYYLHSELQTEVDSNCQNKRQINQLKRDYSQYEDFRDGTWMTKRTETGRTDEAERTELERTN
ncbi:hypothetical protein C1645_821049 [Glomus cerebriforme]|uniref:Uncharacterized protein n=1 Tax=Glomus cerebriforme TaxID=658196 RepID=A0A397TAY6_9GLOM|nr:hypothetical protein C1645_821049 [Glomus cerebriforme]